MKIQQHIPGPWEAGTGDNDGYESITIEHEGFPICEVRGTDDMSCIDDDEEEARIASEMVSTARLICAAPDLLQALEAARDHLEYVGYGDDWERQGTESLRDQIDEAIAKAKGS